MRLLNLLPEKYQNTAVFDMIDKQVKDVFTSGRYKMYDDFADAVYNVCQSHGVDYNEYLEYLREKRIRGNT